MLPMYDGQKQGDVAEDSKLARMLTMMIRFLTKHVPGRIQYENRTLTRLSFGTRRCLWGESVGMKNSLKGLFADICCVLGQNTPPIPFHRNVRRTTVQKLEQQLSYYDMTKCGCILYKQYVYTYIYIHIYNMYTKHIHFCCFGCGWFMGRLPTQNMPGQKDHGVLLEYLVPARLDMANARDIPRTYPLTLLFNRCTWRWGPAKVSWSVQQALIFAIIIFWISCPLKLDDFLWGQVSFLHSILLWSNVTPFWEGSIRDSFLRGFNLESAVSVL